MRPPLDMRRPRRGVALLLVLGVLAALAWLSAAIVLESRRRIAEQSAFTRRAELRAAADSATAAAVAILRERALADGGLYAVEHDLTRAMAEGGYAAPAGMSVRALAEDLSGRYGLRGMDGDALRDLFTDLDVPFEDAANLATGFLAVAHPGRRGELADADDAPAAPDFPGEDWDDFAEVKGFAKFFKNRDGSPNARFDELRDCLSLTGDTPKPNVNSARPALLRHLVKRGMISAAEAPDRWLAGADARRGTADDRFARLPADLDATGCGPVNPAVVLTVSRVRIVVTVTLGEGVFRMTSDFDPQSASTTFPWKRLAVREGRVAW